VDIDQLLAGYHARVVGTKIRGQTVESVELCIDTNNGQNNLRYFLHVFFAEPELPTNMNPNLKLLRRVFWDTDYAVVTLNTEEIRPALSGEMEVPEHQWTLSDELRNCE